jgi:hypothetical protein
MEQVQDCKYVCPRALAVPPAPNRGLQGDSDYFHEVVNHTSHSAAKRAVNRKNYSHSFTLWRNFAADLPMYPCIPNSKCNFKLAEDEIFKFLLKLELQLD